MPYVSLNAIANLGYADGRFDETVYPNDETVYPNIDLLKSWRTKTLW